MNERVVVYFYPAGSPFNFLKGLERVALIGKFNSEMSTVDVIRMYHMEQNDLKGEKPQREYKK